MSVIIVRKCANSDLGIQGVSLSQWQCLGLYASAVSSEDLARAACLVLYVCNTPACLLHII